MRYIWQHIQTILATYDGGMPLAHFLKHYFRENPILGSRDRKLVSAMAYSWYRCSKGIAYESTPTEAAIKECLRLCKSELLNNSKLFPPEEAGEAVAYDEHALFPHAIALSAGITKAEWLGSMLVQPDFFIRVRKDKGKLVSLLNSQNIPLTFITDQCIGLPNGAKVDSLLPEDAYAVQDASSQQTGSFFKPGKNEQWYDCCSGAGGKALLLKDMENSTRITVSDKRETIIYNLKKRFALYGQHLPVAHVTDTANRAQLEKALGTKQFDGIICDAPCSGSGTWARTPEQLYFFDPAALAQFPPLQTAIAVNAARHLKPGGRFIYITCSVFEQENEDVVAEIVRQTGLEIESTQLINGVNIHADNMYVAVLKKANPAS